MGEQAVPEAGQRWQHAKRGTTYEVVGIAELQAGIPQGDHAAENAALRGRMSG